jgi:hypothetical protein
MPQKSLEASYTEDFYPHSSYVMPFMLKRKWLPCGTFAFWTIIRWDHREGSDLRIKDA